MAQKKSNIIINTIVLCVITVVAVAALAFVNQLTAPIIADADAAASAAAYESVYEGGTFAVIDGLDQMIADSEALLADNGFDGCTIVDAYEVNGGEGYIISSTSPNGYGGEIQVAFGICDGKLTGFTVVSHSETAGLGSKCTEPEFQDQFVGKLAEVLTFTKNGASSDTEIDAMSGATITTNAVTQAVNAGIIFYQQNFGGGVQEIAGPDLTEFYQAAYPDATSFDDIENASELIEASASLLEGYGLTDCTVEEVKAVNGGEGYVISTTGIGFAKTSPIQIVIGIKDGVITGYSVVSHMETEGYGAVCDDDEYCAQFAGKQATILSSNKDGNSSDTQIDAISGATFTTNAITSAVNSAVVFYQTNFGGGEIDADAIANSVDAASSATA